MTLKTITEVNELNWNDLDIYYWELYNHTVDTYQYKVSKEHTKQFKYVYNRLKG